ncbi:unnamed protein product, partial [Laminaria digitata]
QGKYAEADPLCLRASGIRKTLGPDHPSVATTRLNDTNGCGDLWPQMDGQGKYAEADPLYLRANGIGEKALGPDHPS